MFVDLLFFHFFKAKMSMLSIFFLLNHLFRIFVVAKVENWVHFMFYSIIHVITNIYKYNVYIFFCRLGIAF